MAHQLPPCNHCLIKKREKMDKLIPAVFLIALIGLFPVAVRIGVSVAQRGKLAATQKGNKVK